MNIKCNVIKVRQNLALNRTSNIVAQLVGRMYVCDDTKVETVMRLSDIDYSTVQS